MTPSFTCFTAPTPSCTSLGAPSQSDIGQTLVCSTGASSSPCTPLTSGVAQSPATSRGFLMTAVVECIQGGQYRRVSKYWSVVDSFVEWCELNHLQLNMTKSHLSHLSSCRGKKRCRWFLITSLGVYLDNKHCSHS